MRFVAAMTTHIAEQLTEIITCIRTAAEKAGRNPDEVKLIAVSKTFPPEAIAAAYACGQFRFGENRLQELEEKVKKLPETIEWHLIGHLQSNKAQRAVQLATYIHSVDSEKLLRRLDRLAMEAGKKPKILLEINISGEESKFGTTESDAVKLVQAALTCEHLELAGLMTMAPYEAPETALHNIFGGLRRLRDYLENHLQIKLPELSMGMSSDFEIAIQEGATFVRVGTAIFGKRTYNL